ncbi:MAG: thioredoxin-dependent thiol peroxidase [bacterium]
MAIIDVQKKAPAFHLETIGGQKYRLSDFLGQKVVVYFYPKDDTPGCTREAIEFTQHLDEFEQADTVIIGISKDSPQKHEKFAKKHDLRIILCSDPDGKIIEKYGCWVEKNMYGRKYMGIERATFLVDRTGKIQEIWRKVRVAGHVEKVLAAAKELA